MRICMIALPLLLVPLGACYHFGELGNLGFHIDLADVLFEFRSGDRVLVGTRVCPRLGFANFGEEGTFVDEFNEHCFEATLDGPVQVDPEGCWTLDTPGEVVWEWTPTQLDDCQADYVGDRVVFEIAAPSGEPRMGFDDWRVRVPMAFGSLGDGDPPQEVVGLGPGRTLADLREDSSAPRRVFAGQLDTPMLRLDDDVGRLYFADADVVFELVGEGAVPVEPVEPDDYSTEVRLWGERPLVLEPDAVAHVRATLPGDLVVESPELVAVPSTDAASLDLIVMVLADGTPAYAYAEVRDDQDRVLHAAPIEWEVLEGALAVQSGDLGSDARTREYALLGGDCLPPEGEPVERRAVLRAELGGLEDSVELTWIEIPDEHADQAPFEPDELCMFGDDIDVDEGGDDQGGDDEVGEAGDDPGIDEGGCACSSEGDHSPIGSAALALAALLFVRRKSSPTGARAAAATRSPARSRPRTSRTRRSS